MRVVTPMQDALSCSLYSKELSYSFRRSRLIVSRTGNDAERLYPELCCRYGTYKT